MKALTLWQPWASLVALGEKRIETRCWSTAYRGPLAIHAAARIPSFCGLSRLNTSFRMEVAEVLGVRLTSVDAEIRKLPISAVLCVVNLVEIEETRCTREYACEREKIFGNYEDGRYAWFLEMVEKFTEPIPAKGNRMLWNWVSA